MKKILLFLCAISLFFGSSCGFFGAREYMCEIETVNAIEIVQLKEFVQEEYHYEYTVLATITDCPAFVYRLNNIKHSVNWGEPGTFSLGYIVIRILYLNGDYDLLYPNAQMFHRDGVNQYGYFFFDADAFHSLIRDYMTK